MSTKNSISIQIPEAELQTARDAVNTIKTILSPYLVALSPSERQTLPKMGDGTLPFVEKVMEYAQEDGQFLPPFLDLQEMDKDWTTLYYRLGPRA